MEANNKIIDKIRDLLNQKKTVRQQIENTPKESSNIDNLEQQNDNLENEIRKQRTQKYETEQMREDLDYIKKSYLYLRKINLVKSQYDFSTSYLNKNKYYLGMILCENRMPSIDGLHTLITNIKQIRDYFEDDINYQAEVRILNNLIESGKNIITNRLFKYL